MIPKINKIEGKFPDKAIITQSSATMNDMGDKSISMQVQIQDLKHDDFAYDWEVEFQGERYIHAIREPQASKGNDSICSTVDLTFQHWTIYQLRRFYYFKTANVGSGVVSADNYIASLSGGFSTFLSEFKQVIKHYYDDTIKVALYGTPNDYDQTAQYLEINYSHIWDVLQKMYEVYGVRWNIKGDTIYVGYPTEEIAHQFEYGFEGGLLKVERQVQSTDIRNSLLGRGGSKNLPYRYFKNVDEHNPSFKADPDWIPELENIYFSELRGKTFRDYVKGWKARHYGGEPMTEPTEAYTKGYNDEKFNPIEFVEYKESIDKYGLLQGGLENQEDIYPSIQGVEVDSIGRVDEVVGVERVTVDENEESLFDSKIEFIPINVSYNSEPLPNTTKTLPLHFRTENIKVTQGRKGVFARDYQVSAIQSGTLVTSYYNGDFGVREYTETFKQRLKCEVNEIKVYNALTNEIISDINIIPDDVEIYLVVDITASSFLEGFDDTYYDPDLGGTYGREVIVQGGFTVSATFEWSLADTYIHGIILGNYVNNAERISKSLTVSGGEINTVTLQSLQFEVPENGATNVDVPVNIITSQDAQGLYEWKRASIEAVNVDTNEVVSAINIPQGKYYLRVKVEIKNLDSKSHTYKVELMPSYIYYPTDIDEFKPKFDIWVKNIWGSTRNEGESDIAYTERVWTPILGDREGDTAKIVFTTGLLSGHSDYEFEIIDVAYAGNEGVEFGGVTAEWRITLAKSTAELEATGKYIPSTQIQAKAGNYFYFIGIDMPHEYVLWAEERLDQRKADKLLETANIKPTWVVQTDKVRLNQVQPHESEPLLDAIKVGNNIRLADTRFIKGAYENLFIQSVTYSWQSDTVLLPNIEIVLSDKVATSLNPVAQIQGQVEALTKQVGSISNVQQVVRAVGDKLYLRKDGIDDTSNSPTTFAKEVHSKDYRQGAIGGKGWGLRTEQGKGILELDKIIVREEMQVNSLVVNQVSAIGGKEILSAASITCSRVETTERGFKCYFDQKRGSIANLFQVHDIAYSQVFNANDIEVKYYKREVIEVGDNYILLSLEDDGEGKGAPQVGDVIAQYGNTDTDNHADRQYVIIRDVIGGGYERMLCNLNSIDAEGEEYYFAGRMNNGKPRWFVGDESQYLKFEDGKIAIECKQVGMTSEGNSDDTVRIWAGADNDKKESAPFRVTQGGKVVATDGEFKGKIIATEGELEKVTVKGSIRSPFSIMPPSLDFSDNPIMPNMTDNVYNKGVSTSWLYDFDLDWDESQSGRRVTLIGIYGIRAPQNKYFFEDGLRSSTLDIVDEIVELIGYGTEEGFHGWIVLNRKKIYNIWREV